MIDTMYLAVGAFVILILALIATLVVLWIAMPFSVFGVKNLLKRLIAEQEKTNALLKNIIDANTREDARRPPDYPDKDITTH